MSRPFLARGGIRNSPTASQPQRGNGRSRRQAIEHGAVHQSHITTVGVQRPGFGVAGKKIQIKTNFFRTTIPDRVIYHYDVVISPSEQKLPARLNMLLVTELQSYTAPDIFQLPAAYDGRKNIFSIERLSLGETDSMEFSVIYPRASNSPNGNKQPKAYKIRLTKVAEINPEILQRYIDGKQSYDNAATTAITAMNVVVRMQPSMQHTHNVRSFFAADQQKDPRSDLRNGLLMWQGYFQSIRPSRSGMLLNIDISTGLVYRDGPLIDLCLNYLGKRENPRALMPGAGKDALQERDRLKLQRFVSGIRVTTRPGSSGPANDAGRILRKLSSHGANSLQFAHNGITKTVAQYYHEILGRPLRYPSMICAEVGNGALIPLELCSVIKGQLTRRQIPPDCVHKVIKFASKSPRDRIQTIESGPSVLGYTTSEYVRQFGLSTTPNGPITINARILDPPALAIKELDGKGNISRRSFIPQSGAWNMDKKMFFSPVAKIYPWAFFVLETERWFTRQDARAAFLVLRHILTDYGVSVPLQPPEYEWGNPQGNIIEQLGTLVSTVHKKAGAPPQIIIVILPELGNDLYSAVKHFGDVHMGIITQCMKSGKCKVENPHLYTPRTPCKPPAGTVQYYSNVALKINVKLGGVNVTFSPSGPGALNDPFNPTIIMGADVIHPTPGATGRPSYAALVGNIDSDMVKYVAATRVQASRLEICNDLRDMAVDILRKWQENRTDGQRKRNTKSNRLIVYRDGVSEGQFKEVLDTELPALKAAAQEVGIDVKITLVIVGKRHHVRFFPRSTADSDKSGNCPAGTVVDEVGHPTEFDFYLQSHAGILGTSRPSHYSVLYDENSFSADTLQKFTYHLCYTYARATRAVSIPAPVYYADLVCSRAKNHYNPYQHGPEEVDENSTNLESFKTAFKPLHENLRNLMYFS